MAEEAQELRRTLSQLHEQLRSSANLSEENRRSLQDLANEIRALLDASSPAVVTSGPADPRQTSLAARLADAEREFEATHPTLSGIVGSIIDALGRMGI